MKQEEAIKAVLSSKLINQSELVRRVNKKGLSVPSLYNKLNDNHPHKFKDEELKDIEKQLEQFARFILKELGK
jgi:hypothetical protein